MDRKWMGIATMGMCLLTASPVGAASPYEDVPLQDSAYEEIRSLANSGLINQEYATRYRDGHVATRLELAGVIANAATKYEHATAEQKKAIQALEIQFAPDLRSMGVELLPCAANKTGDKPSARESLEDRVKELENRE